MLFARTIETFWYGLGVDEDGLFSSAEGAFGAGVEGELAFKARRATILS